MKTFNLERQWSGYSRGYDTITVVANTLEEALEYTEDMDGERSVTRNDTEADDWEEIK